MYYPTLEQIKEIIKTGDYNLVPVCKEMYGDSITPIEVMRILKKHSKHCYMLESVDDTKRWSRYTFMGYDPKSEITCLNNLMLSLINISEPTRLRRISYAVFCLTKNQSS